MKTRLTAPGGYVITDLLGYASLSGRRCACVQASKEGSSTTIIWWVPLDSITITVTSS